jgi:hypothetical protein
MSNYDILEPIINNLIFQSQQSPGLPHFYAFADDLRVDVLIEANGTIMRLSYVEDFPEIEEYLLFLHAWPYEVPPFTPQAVAHSGRKFLTGSWPTPAT